MDNKELQILNLSKSGNSGSKIANILHLSTYTVYSILEKHGLLKKRKIKFPRKSKYSIDESFFEKIDTEEKAYILGFLYADGNISKVRNTISITLKSSDKYHLEKIKNILKYTGNLNLYKSRYSKNYIFTEKVMLSFCNKKIHEDLINKNLVPNKSLILEYPDITILPELLHPHFMRGYFDGDGTIFQENQSKKYRFGIISTKEFCEKYLQNLPVDKVSIIKEKRTIKNVYYFTVAKQKDIENIFNFLYQDATIYLDRKKEKFEEFMTNRGSTTIIREPEMVMV